MAATRFAYVPTLTLFEGWAGYPADLNALDDPFLRESLCEEAEPILFAVFIGLTSVRCATQRPSVGV